MYALNLDKTTSRIESVTYPEYAGPNDVIVDVLPEKVVEWQAAPWADEMPPEADAHNYLCINKAYFYDPLPKPDPRAAYKVNRNIVTGECVTLNGTLYKAIKNIPSGEPVIIGQNAVKTTYEAELLALSQQKG